MVEQLLDLVLRCVTTVTEVEADGMDHITIKNNKVVIPGPFRNFASLAGWMTQLYTQSQGLECGSLETDPVPFLRDASVYLIRC